MVSQKLIFDTQHEDMLHDAQMDYYGKRLATCSSDRTIRVFTVDGEKQTPFDHMKGHDGPVWQVGWAHPKFGVILASCSYDGRVIIWKLEGDKFRNIKEHVAHTASVNSIAWAPHEFGAYLACASSDGKVSVLSYRDDGTWDTQVFDAHAIGCNAVTWAPAAVPGSLLHAGPPASPGTRRFASAGCDNMIKIWSWNEEAKRWKEDDTLEGHSDWVRDLAWAPSIGLPKSYLASCSQDKTVLIWTQDRPNGQWTKKALTAEKFPDAVWRVSWSLAGNILAVSCGDNRVTLWKENLLGDWECVSDLDGGVAQ